jgi:hypothetical protein
VGDAGVDKEIILGAASGNRAIEVARVSLNQIRMKPLMRTLITALFRASRTSSSMTLALMPSRIRSVAYAQRFCDCVIKLFPCDR